jgi:hypothetical protein
MIGSWHTRLKIRVASTFSQIEPPESGHREAGSGREYAFSRPSPKSCQSGVAVDLDHREIQSATLGLEIESVDKDLSQVGGVDPWNSAAVNF